MPTMNVGVFGLGYVGALTAACLASRGHKVIGVDISLDKAEAINAGRSPILEHGLDDLIHKHVRAGNLHATCDAMEAVLHSDVMLVCVGTPSEENGNVDFEYVDRVCTEIARGLRSVSEYRLIVLRSTLLPGTFGKRLLPLVIRESGKQAGRDFGMTINPEFLREGHGIEDFENPPFTLIGEMDKGSGDALEALYAGISAPVIRTDPDTACMVKYASNAYHGLKVAFANEIGRLCKTLGMDGTEVMEIFCEDTNLNISSRYLRPGFAFGGSCLPKDLRGLLYLARHNDLEVPILESILPSNRMQIQKVADLILRDGRRNVGILGLSFKPGTDDLRESPVVELVEVLSGKGVTVRIYDANVSLSTLMGSNKAYIERVIPHIAAMMYASRNEMVQDSDVIVVAHDPDIDKEQLADVMRKDQLLIDFVKLVPDRDRWSSAYEGISW